MRIALIGFGEVGRIFHDDLHTSHDLVAWDIRFADAGSPAARNAAETGVAQAASAQDAASGADIILCAVTASNDLAAAQSVIGGLQTGGWFFDLNSSSPGQKRAASAAINDAGGRYVEAALMAPIAPTRMASPFLLGGGFGEQFLAEVAPALQMSGASFLSVEVGVAAATKLCRSVIVKGLESLFGEALLAAREYGVEQDVVSSLSNILPPADWEKVASYFISRSLEHGVRRSEEMHEAARTVAEAGFEPRMASAAAVHEMWAAQFAQESMPDDLYAMLDGIRKAHHA